MSEGNVPLELAEEFNALHDLLVTDGDIDTAMRRLVHLAVETVPGCDWAAVTSWPTPSEPVILATTDDVAAAVDQRQYAIGEGPCLTAAASDAEVVLLPDVAHDDTWPRFSQALLAETPVRAVLSFHLGDAPHRSALNLYSARAAAFDREGVGLAALFAAHVRVLLAHAASTDKVSNLETALNTSRLIGTAIGVLMNAHRITGDEALDLLRSSSQHLNRKLRDVASEVTETGALPDGD